MLDQLVNSPNCYIHIFRLNFCPQWGSAPQPFEVKIQSATDSAIELYKVSGGFSARGMTDVINNIIKEGCIPDDWRKSILAPVYNGKGDPLV